jgi:peptidoglycan hydrolase-like amidase
MKTPVIDAWKDQAATKYAIQKTLTKGDHTVKLQYRESTGKAVVKLDWENMQTADFSATTALTIKDSTGKQLMSIAKGQKVSVGYDPNHGSYYVLANGALAESSNYIVLDPGSGITTVSSYSGTNKEYAGDMVVRASDITKHINIINRIPIETYLNGLWGETGMNSDPEYTKALIIAARTYALYHYYSGGKHKDDYYHLNNTSSDQVYSGYNSNSTSVIVKAVTATKGYVVTHPQSTYRDHIAVTSYFSQSDGHTRNSEDVWSGVWPWARSVEDPWWYDGSNQCIDGRVNSEGRVMRGHGVGLSGRGAYCYATMEGKKYDWLLTHYYTGITIQKNYPTDNIILDIGIYAIDY